MQGRCNDIRGQGVQILGLHTGEMWESVGVLGHAGWVLRKAGMDK